MNFESLNNWFNRSINPDAQQRKAAAQKLLCFGHRQR